MSWAYVTGGQVRRIAETPDRVNWLPVHEAEPVHDPQTEQLRFDSYDVTETAVIRRWRAEPLPMTRAEVAPAVAAITAMDTASRTALNAAGTVEGAAWSQPAGAHDAYPMGWQVKHNGKTWASLTPSNVWEPGVSGWREIPTDPGAVPDWQQPTGAHDAYDLDDHVMHNGSEWGSTVSANTWEPGVYGWTKI